MKDIEYQEFSHVLINFSDGKESKAFAGQVAKDGEQLTYLDKFDSMGRIPKTRPADKHLDNVQG